MQTKLVANAETAIQYNSMKTCQHMRYAEQVCCGRCLGMAISIMPQLEAKMWWLFEEKQVSCGRCREMYILPPPPPSPVWFPAKYHEFEGIRYYLMMAIVIKSPAIRIHLQNSEGKTEYFTLQSLTDI